MEDENKSLLRNQRRNHKTIERVTQKLEEYSELLEEGRYEE